MENLVLKIAKEINLNEHETEIPLHDINNLRGYEWEEIIKNQCTKETYKEFKKTI